MTPDEAGASAGAAAPGAQPAANQSIRRQQARTPIGKAALWVDDRLGTSDFAKSALDKIFPDHWSFMVGEIAMYCFAILVFTGTYLTFFFSASDNQVTYSGGYKPLQGVKVSDAYRSVLDITFKVRAGLVIRQIHHWAALIFVAAIVVHLCRVFFTGAFRRPREINWMVGVTLLLLAIANGFTGYSLPDDLLSGTGLRIAYSIVLSIPFVGPYVGYLVFGSPFPGNAIIQRLFIIHVLFVPVLIGALLSLHLAILWRQKHTDFPGPGKTESTIAGSRLWPQYMAKSIVLFCFVAAVLAGLGGLAQINPVWIYGPYKPAAATFASQPDWYIGWLEGALRVMPNFEIRALHHTVANTFFPGVLLPGITFGLLYGWPFLEARFTRDRRPHNLLDRPRDHSVRTAFGAATLGFYTVLVLAGGNDVLAGTFGLSFEALLRAFQVSCIVVPILFGFVTWKICKEMARQRVHPIQQPVGGVIVREPGGGYRVLGALDGHGNGHGAPAEADAAPAQPVPGRAPASGDAQPGDD